MVTSWSVKSPLRLPSPLLRWVVGMAQSHPGSLLVLLSRRKWRSWVLGNQPDRLPGCQHLRNAKPPLRQGWVLRAGCSVRAGC